MEKSEKNNLLIYGKHAIREALSRDTGKISKIFVLNSMAPIKYDDLKEECEAHNIPISSVPIQKLDRLSNLGNHQGFIAEISPINYTNFFDWIEQTMVGPTTAVLLLDSIQDPHNLGAIIRSATAAGISAIIIPTQQQVPVNATVFKVSAGTAGIIPVIRVHNTEQGLKDLKLAGFKLIGLEGNASDSLWSAEWTGPLAFVVGSEGRGISKKVAKLLDSSASIPMEHAVESLNASVIAALISYEWKRRQA
tara:strand:+ start:12167 stop:12916 length:750 start_codon:yes stop_codon:yes gene_type:complete